MGRARCDPIDVAATLARLSAGAPRPSVYRAYAETAARPYSRASWEALLRLGQASLAKPSEGRQRATVNDADAESDAFWEPRLSVKPRVITTEADNASLSVKGGSLFVYDGERRLRYDPGSRMPSAIVMAGWGGVVSIEAIRFCGSQPNSDYRPRLDARVDDSYANAIERQRRDAARPSVRRSASDRCSHRSSETRERRAGWRYHHKRGRPVHTCGGPRAQRSRGDDR
jgi:hypothetical protein